MAGIAGPTATAMCALVDTNDTSRRNIDLFPMLIAHPLLADTQHLVHIACFTFDYFRPRAIVILWHSGTLFRTPLHSQVMVLCAAALCAFT